MSFFSRNGKQPVYNFYGYFFLKNKKNNASFEKCGKIDI